MLHAIDLRILPPWAGLLLAGGLVAVTLLLRWGLAAYVDNQPILILFVLPIIVGAYLGGIKTGLAATVAAAISSNYFLLPPVYSLAILKPAHQVQWGLLWLIGIAVSLLAEELIRSRRQAKAHRERMEELSRSAALFPEQNPYPVMRAARGGELLYANRAAAKLLEQWQCPVGARVPEAVQRELAAVLESGSPQELELPCGDRELSFALVPIADRHYVNFYGRDITAQKSAQEALRKSERLYRAIGESIDYGVWVCAADGRNQYASESFLKMVGITQQQCSDFGWGDVLHPEDAERTIAAWKECVRTGGTWDIEHRFRGADGRWHAVLARGVPVKNEKGEILCWAGINLDIRRFKQTEEALRGAHERLRTILGSISDGFIGLDRQWRVTFVNQRGAEDVGQTRETMLGRVLWEIFPEAVGSDFENAYRRAMTQRVTTTAEAYYPPLNAWFEARAYPSEDGISVFFRDISERKQTETKLKQSEEALRQTNEHLEEMVRKRTLELEDTVATLENEIASRKKIQTQLHQLSRVFMDAADPIIIEDLSGTIIEMNREAEAVYAWSRDELLGKPIATLFLPERFQPAVQLRERCRKGEEVRNWEGMRKTKSGRIIPSLLTAFPLMDEAGKIAFVATICKDISARKEMETKLQEAHRHLRELSRKSLEALEVDRRTVARELHDSIGGSLAAIKFGLEDVAEQALRDPVCGAGQLETLISHLADAIKETKRISANLRPLSIDDLGLLATIEWYTRQFCQRYENIQVICQIGVEEQEIPEEFKIVFYRVMQEALTNAAKHSRADTIIIRLTKEASHFEFEVEDNGCGFDSSETFGRQDRLSGFGLKSMQERAEICGGFLNLRTRPERGTSVSVTLPFGAAASGF